MPSFGDLPNEIILDVCEHLARSHLVATAAFKSLSLVSRRLHRLAEPFLYRSITLKVTTPAPSLLVSTLQDHLERADLVRKLDIVLDIPRYDGREKDTRHERRDHVLDRFRKAVDAFELPEPMAFHWNSLFDSSDEQGAACAALAISMCPNLEELHLRYNGYGTTKHAEPWPLRLFTDQSVGGAASKMLQKICGNLRTLRFSRLDRRLGPIGDIRVLPHVPFVEVPSLNHLEISGAREQHYTISRAGAVWDAFLSRHVDASLEKFVLRETEMPFPLLESILRSCHGLKEFYYEMAASVYHDRKIKFDYARLCRAMEQHRTSLESLSINFFDGSAHRVFDFVDQTAPSFLNLSDFPRLKTVRASVNALLPETIQNVSTRLPLSLERLELFSADEEDWKTFLPLERFIQRDLAIFPKLQCISVLSPDPDFMYWADTKMRLAEQGVSLIVE